MTAQTTLIKPNGDLIMIIQLSTEELINFKISLHQHYSKAINEFENALTPLIETYKLDTFHKDFSKARQIFRDSVKDAPILIKI
jgi:hypothetical protein